MIIVNEKQNNDNNNNIKFLTNINGYVDKILKK